MATKYHRPQSSICRMFLLIESLKIYLRTTGHAVYTLVFIPQVKKLVINIWRQFIVTMTSFTVLPALFQVALLFWSTCDPLKRVNHHCILIFLSVVCTVLQICCLVYVTWRLRCEVTLTTTILIRVLYESHVTFMCMKVMKLFYS